METVPSSDGALLKGLRLELDLRLAPVGADGKQGTLAVLRVERARLGVPGSGATPHRAWAIAAGVFSVALSVVLWFALDPNRAAPPSVFSAMAELPAPAPASVPPPSLALSPPLQSIDTAPRSEPQPPLAVTPISPSVSIVRAPDPPSVARSQPASATGRTRAPVPKAGLPAAAGRAAAPTPAAAPAATPEPARAVDVLDLFADTK